MGQLPLLLLLGQVASALGDPLETHYRPPQQTTEQNYAQAQLVANAHQQSQDAKGWVVDYLRNEVLPALSDNWLGQQTPEQLLERLDWEFAHMPLIHNGPVDETDKPPIMDDSYLATTMDNGYLQNTCQRWVFGTTTQDDSSYLGEVNIQCKFMYLPGFAKDARDPTLREANNCVMYLATNLLKTHCGTVAYGSVTYVVNPIYRDKMALAPFDTGTYWEQHQQQMVFGTFQDYYHVFQAHIQVLNYNFAEVFKRWYLGMPPPQLAQFPYLEVDWFGNAWFPESMLYVIVQYSSDGGGIGMWGTVGGRNLQNKMRYRGKPVVWSDGSDSGMLIDGTVNMIEGGRIGQEASDYFNSHWDSNTPWQDFYNMSPEYLKFFLPQYDRRDICTEAEGNDKLAVMGHDRLGNCVFWAYPAFQQKWECLNDGTCELSSSERAVYNTQEDCLQSCAHGKWACIANDPQARPGAHYCIPSPNSGLCSDVDSCEASCNPGFTCSAAATLGNASAMPWATPTYV